ncbi:hypothetical protein BH23GEM3_BH23GEM3_21590 [soil metagenome]
MAHPQLIEAFQTLSAFGEALSRLPDPGTSLRLEELAGASPALLVGALHRARPERLWVVIAADPDAAEQAASDMDALLGEGAAVLFPQRESLPYDEGEPHVEIGGLRVEALEALLAGRVAILVTTPRATQELAPAVDGIADLRLELRAAQEIRPSDLTEQLDSMGFERVPTVEEVGQYALRGGILDIFGFGTPEPARVEFWGDEIESIRHFDIFTQRSVRTVDALQILPVDLQPVREPRGSVTGGAADPATAPRRSLLDYLPEYAVLVHLPGCDPDAEWERTWEEVQRLHRAEVGVKRHVEAPDWIFLPPDQARARRDAHPQLRLLSGREPAAGGIPFRTLPPEPIDRDTERLGALVREGFSRGERTMILCDNEGQLERLQELLDEQRAGGAVTLSVGSLSGGFVLSAATPPLRVLTDHEIFRRTRRLRRRRQFRGGAAIESFAAVKPGEYVVHLDHGVGQFKGMEEVRVGDTSFETLVIEYAGGELLRVPVHRIDMIERWVSDGDDAPPPRVHRIGGKEWSRTRSRTRKSIE